MSKADDKLQLPLNFVQQVVAANVEEPELVAIEEYPQEQEFLGFHDEFMARLQEFSLSWRQAAMNERKF